MADSDQNPEEEPRPMSQDEIDSLFAQLQNDQETSGQVKKEDSKQADEADAAPAAEKKEPGTGPLDQSDIDALLNELNDEEPAAEAAAEGAPAAEEAAADGPLGQDDIDALLANMGATEEPAPANDEPDSNTEAAAQDEGSLGQDDIDALLSSMGAGDEEPAAEAAPEPEAAADGPLGQDDIDSLLANMGVGDAAPEEPAAAEPEPAAEAPADDAALGQDDIDALLASMGGGDAAEEDAKETLVQEVQDDDALMGQDDIDALVAQLGGGMPDSAYNEVAPDDSAAADAEAMINQNDIDNLLQEMGINDDGQKPVGPPTGQLLSTEQIMGIVEKNEDTLSDNEDEAMIDQSDIDALVREMSEATGVPDQEELDSKMHNKSDDIEALLQEASSPMATHDAVQGSVAFGGQQSLAQVPTMSIDQAAVMAPDELRGTKYLLVAAVFLLAMCAVTMGFVVSAINDLAIELEQNRTSEIKPLDDFQENIEFAKKMLSGEDDMEVVQGIKFVNQLKENYDKDPEKIILLSLLLADHYRGAGAYSKAKKEYKVMTERQGALYENPQHYLDYAETLFSIGEEHYDEAANVLYRLLANEHYYMSDQAQDGALRSASDIRQNNRIIQEAYLKLGQIYTAQIDGKQKQGDA